MTTTTKTAKNTPAVSTTKAATPTRDELRAQIFGSKPRSKLVEDFFGTTIEIRQPTLVIALSQRQADDEDRLYFMLAEYAFVPGTDQKLFDREDIDNIKGLPFGPEFTRLMDAVNSLLGINAKEVEAEIRAAEKSD